MAIDEFDVVVGHLVGDVEGLLGVAGVVADRELELAAQHPALGVDILHRHLGAALHLLAEGGVLPGDRPDHRHVEVVRPNRAGSNDESGGGQHDNLGHRYELPCLPKCRTLAGRAGRCQRPSAARATPAGQPSRKARDIAAA
jgi:hypothetical protein